MVLGIISIGLILLGGFLWRLGGSDYAPVSVRRLGVAGVLSVIVLLAVLGDFPLINIWLGLLVIAGTFGASFGAFTMPYGVPDPPSHPCPDEGSVLGRFFYHLFHIYSEHRRRLYTDICVRATCGFIYGLSYLPLAIVYKGSIGLSFLVLVPTILVPTIVALRVDRINGWIEEFLIGCVITFGMVLTWII